MAAVGNTPELDALLVKAQHLIEAFPYLQRHRGKLAVIKYGGAAMIDEELKEAVLQDLVLMDMVGIKVVIVHGGGKEITQLLDRLGAKTTFIKGQRVTDLESLGVAEMVLAGKISGDIVSGLNARGVRAVGLSGKAANLLTAKRLVGEDDLGFVGDIEKVNPEVIHSLTKDGFIPVISPIGIGTDGQTYNINADVAALEIAKGVGAQKLIFLSDIPGVLRDPKNESSLISTIQQSEIEPLITQGIVSGGMIPKLRSAGDALAVCNKVHILDGRRPHSLLLELFTDEGIGTQIIRG
jgi:acetylglutamate kinase